ncbi:MAG: Mrp/NBP35 family ATP-binding protein [Planctomycetia bacterium]|nr:Mrp/NBP35 family ATP-binding protein [Planctomycetia bacterium]
MSENCNHNCESCQEECASKAHMPQKVELGASSTVKKVFGVVSGKGGVGKSLVTSLLAVELCRKGLSTAILDADITGPSIPKIFGLKEKVFAGENGLIPITSAGGIRIMSANSLLENETDPLVWRGPLIAGTICQLWSETDWGNVDRLLVDMPPGTGDVPLTVFQSLPVDGIIVVTSPQELVGMIVEKAIKMANIMNVPVLGIVENMSWFQCPECGSRYSLFGESQVARVAEQFNIKTTACIPMMPDMAKLCDQGRIEVFQGDWLKPLLDVLQ